MEQTELDACGLSQDERLSLWKSRPWRYKLGHRWNVVSALFGRQITWSTALRGLRFPHESVLLEACSSVPSMLVVCPVAVRDLEQSRRNRFLQIPPVNPPKSQAISTACTASNNDIKKLAKDAWFR